MSKEKQIEEMACENCLHHLACLVNSEYVPTPCPAYEDKAGYRKQSEGEWIVTNKNGFWYYDCPFCDDGYAQEAKLPVSNYCANCGAKLNEPKMKGGAERWQGILMRNIYSSVKLADIIEAVVVTLGAKTESAILLICQRYTQPMSWKWCDARIAFTL